MFIDTKPFHYNVEFVINACHNSVNSFTPIIFRHGLYQESYALIPICHGPTKEREEERMRSREGERLGGENRERERDLERKRIQEREISIAFQYIHYML